MVKTTLSTLSTPPDTRADKEFVLEKITLSDQCWFKEINITEKIESIFDNLYI